MCAKISFHAVRHANDAASYVVRLQVLVDFIAKSQGVFLQFENDVYIATSEPHGNIEATITRNQVQPHCKL